MLQKSQVNIPLRDKGESWARRKVKSMAANMNGQRPRNPQWNRKATNLDLPLSLRIKRKERAGVRRILVNHVRVKMEVGSREEGQKKTQTGEGGCRSPSYRLKGAPRAHN